MLCKQYSVTILVDFFKLQVANFLTNIAKTYDDCKGKFEKRQSLSKNCCGILLGQHLKTFGLLFTSDFGHIGSVVGLHVLIGSF